MKTNDFTSFAKGEISENSLYDDKTKKDFLNDEESIVNAFFFNFVGTIAAYEAAVKKERILKYIKSDLKLRVNNVTDDNHDISLTVKLMSDKGFFKTNQVVKEMTRFLAKLKQGGIDSVDASILQSWLDSLSPGVIKKASLPIMRLAEDLIATGDIVFFADRMRDLRKRYEVSGEFASITRGIFFKKSGRTKLSDPPDLKNPNASSDGSTGSVDNSRQPADGRSSIDGVDAPDDMTDTDDEVEVGTPEVPNEPEIVLPKDLLEAVDQIMRGELPVNSLDNYKIKPTEKKDVLAKVLYNRPVTRSTSETIDQISRMVGIAEHLNKPDKKKVADVVSKMAKNIPLKGSGIEGKINAAIDFTKISKEVLDFVEKYAKDPVTDRHIAKLYYDIAIKFSKEDPELDTLSNHKDGIEALKRIPPDNGMNLDNSIESLTKISGWKYAKIFLARIFMYDRPAEAKAFLEKSISGSILDIGGRTVFSDSEPKDPWSSDFQDSDGVSEIGKFLEKIGIHPIGKAGEIFQKLNGGMGVIKRDLSSDYKENPDEFFEALEMVRQEGSFNSVISVLTNHDEKWASDQTTIRAVTEVAKRNLNHSEALALGHSYLFGSFLTYSGIDDIADDGFGPLINELVRVSISNIRSDVESFLDEKMSRKRTFQRFRLSDKSQHTIISASHEAGEPSFPEWFIQEWYDIAIKNVKVENGWSVKGAPGLEIDTLNDPGPLVSLLTEKQISDLILKLTKSFDRNERSAPRLILKIASQGGRKSYSEMDERIRERIDEMMEDSVKSDGSDFHSVIINTGQIMDREFYEKYVKENLDRIYSASFYRIQTAIKDENIREFFINEYLSDPEKKKDFIDESGLKEFLEVNEKSLSLENNIEEKIISAFSATRRDPWLTPRELERITGESAEEDYPKVSKDNKVTALKEALKIVDDPDIVSKLTTEYRESLPAVKNAMLDLVNDDRFEAERIYANMTKSMRRQIANAYLQRQGFILDAQSALKTQTSDNPIISYEELDNKRIKQILKYNNVITEESKLKDSKIKNFDTMDEYAEQENDVPFEPLQVDIIEETEEELEAKSAKYHQNNRNNKHGSSGLRFIRSFDVAIPIQQEEQEQWIAKKPDQEIINPMFHGTGSTAASMILRYGFRVIKSGDPSVVGRMLGNGVYGAIHIDKVQQYIGDSGFSRSDGTKGFIFEMNAALGERGEDYDVAGLRRDGIRSPEWCVFNPNAQFRIFRAHEVEIVPKREIQKMIKKAGSSSVNEEYKNIREIPVSKTKFSLFYEDTLNEEAENYTTYTFVNGVIPVSETDIVDFEEFTSNKKGVSMEPSAYGPMIVVRGTDSHNNYMFTSVADLASNHPEVFQKYLRQVT